MDDIILNKISTIEKCIKRIHKEYDEDQWETNITKQDSVILNLQRACEAAIDLATRIVRLKKLGIPQTSRDVFIFLENEGIIPKQLSRNLQAMVGFRNIAVHDYQKVNLIIVRAIITNNLSDFEKFINISRRLI